MKCTREVKNKNRKKYLSKGLSRQLVFLFFLTGFIFPILNGQEDGTFSRFQNQFSVALNVVIPDGISSLQYLKNSPQLSSNKIPQQWQSIALPSPDRSPRIYNYQEIGIFCKLDVKLDKISKIPIRFRLGTQEAVDRKEGK